MIRLPLMGLVFACAVSMTSCGTKSRQASGNSDTAAVAVSVADPVYAKGYAVKHLPGNVRLVDIHDPQKEEGNTFRYALVPRGTKPAGIPADHSYARIEDGVGQWIIKGGDETSGYVTPSTNNVTLDSNEKIEMFSEHDPFGVGMAIMAMAIVFSGLLLLYLMFRLIGQITVFVKKRNAMRVHGISDKEEAKEKGLGRESGEVYAAIAMALYQHLEVHDVEDTILTINKVKKAYSPWNSKIYSLREVPNKK